MIEKEKKTNYYCLQEGFFLSSLACWLLWCLPFFGGYCCCLKRMSGLVWFVGVWWKYAVKLREKEIENECTMSTHTHIYIYRYSCGFERIVIKHSCSQMHERLRVIIRGTSVNKMQHSWNKRREARANTRPKIYSFRATKSVNQRFWTAKSRFCNSRIVKCSAVHDFKSWLR